MTEFGKQLAKNVRALRQHKRMTQEELSHRIGYKGFNYITLVESNKRQVSVEKLEQLCDVLKTTPNALLLNAENNNVAAADTVIERIVGLLKRKTPEELVLVEQLLCTVEELSKAKGLLQQHEENPKE